MQAVPFFSETVSEPALASEVGDNDALAPLGARSSEMPQRPFPRWALRPTAILNREPTNRLGESLPRVRRPGRPFSGLLARCVPTSPARCQKHLSDEAHPPGA